MTTIRTVATHEIVSALHPRPVTERDERAMIAGRVVDATVSRASHETRLGRRPTTSSLLRAAGESYDRELRDADLPEDPAERESVLAQVASVLRAFRNSPLMGLPRPRTRLILVNDEVGIYAQPDFWDGSRRIYEMKSYRPVPVPPDVALQLRFFQLAYPGFEAVLVGFDRHRSPAETTSVPMPAPTSEEADSALQAGLRIGREAGIPKVREYLSEPIVAYRVRIA